MYNVSWSLLCSFLNFPFLFHVCFQGKYEWGINDCDKALKLCKESRKALYRKALCLKALGKYREAYDCTTACLLISRLVRRAGLTVFAITRAKSKSKYTSLGFG